MSIDINNGYVHQFSALLSYFLVMVSDLNYGCSDIFLYICSHLRKFKTNIISFNKIDKTVPFSFIPNDIRLFQQIHNTTQFET